MGYPRNNEKINNITLHFINIEEEKMLHEIKLNILYD